MVDVRYADSTTAGNKELLYGVTVSNLPTTQQSMGSDSIEVPLIQETEKQRLYQLSPETYTGKAAELEKISETKIE